MWRGHPCHELLRNAAHHSYSSAGIGRLWSRTPTALPVVWISTWSLTGNRAVGGRIGRLLYKI